ncbi:MAG: hypothetical protein ACI97N_002141 [Cognaticolwellia sp.]|jgi:hypothetical protein
MKYQSTLLFFVLILMISSCKDKSSTAASMLCECNNDLVEYNQKLAKLKTENDVNSIAEMQLEGDKLIAAAEKCFQEMETALGGKLMNNKDFEVKVMAKLEKDCPEVFKAYKKVSIEE